MYIAPEERRPFPFAVNPKYRNNTAYWNEFVASVFGGDGINYIYAWLYGMKPNPSFKPGVPTVKGYVRVRAGEKNDNNDPLESLFTAWFATAQQVTTTQKKWIQHAGSGLMIVVTSQQQETVLGTHPLRSKASTGKFIEDWFGGKDPSADRPHYNQVLLATPTPICKEELLQKCKADLKKRAYTTHNLQNEVRQMFGERHMQQLWHQAHTNRKISLTVGSRDEFLQPLINAMCDEIELYKPNKLPDNPAPGVWPISYERLTKFLWHGIAEVTSNNSFTYSQRDLIVDIGEAHNQVFFTWPSGPELRRLYLDNTGAERTPENQYPDWSVDHDWYLEGFPSLAGHRTHELAVASVGVLPQQEEEEVAPAWVVDAMLGDQ
jgi:hypothetical protein